MNYIVTVKKEEHLVQSSRLSENMQFKGLLPEV